MADEKYSTLEWNIKNFSSWNYLVHGQDIISDVSSFFDFVIELYPRGENALGEHLVVHICCYSDFIKISGELSIIGPDGSFLCMRKVNKKSNERIIKLPPGPKFKEVANHIRKNEDLHEDQITVRFRIKDINDSVECMTTYIELNEFFVKISPKSFTNLGVRRIPFFCFKNFLDNGRNKVIESELEFSAGKDKHENSKLLLVLKPINLFRNCSVFVRMLVLNNEDDIVRREDNEHVFLSKKLESWKFSNTLTVREIKESNFNLIFCFKIAGSAYRHSFGPIMQSKTIQSGKVTIRPMNVFKGYVFEERLFKPDNTLKVLGSELMSLYQDQAFSDFRLRCGNVTFPVHRNILSARSPVFKTMLFCDMLEATSGSLVITDLELSTLTLFLIFLYSGNVEDMQWDVALKLYYAADKYQVASLKKKCVDFLSAEVSVSNVCYILTLADRHRDDELTRVAHNFILLNYKKVLNSKEWKMFMKTNPNLLLETLTKFADKNPGNVFLYKKSQVNRQNYPISVTDFVFILGVLSVPILLFFSWK